MLPESVRRGLFIGARGPPGAVAYLFNNFLDQYGHTKNKKKEIRPTYIHNRKNESLI